MLHAQSGIRSDTSTTPGARLRIGDERSSASLRAVARTINTIIRE
ncbi:glycyl radical enzyme domain-containing protein [Shigella flexneri]